MDCQQPLMTSTTTARKLKEGLVSFNNPDFAADDVETDNSFRTNKVDDNCTEPLPTDEKKLSNYFEDILAGKKVPVDYEQNIDVKPIWFDEDKFIRGQKFARSHLFCITYAEMMTLYLMFTLKDSLKPLIFTGQSGTPFKAFRRYFSTLTRVLSWYEGVPWGEENEFRKNVRVVRNMHRNIFMRLASATGEELNTKTTLGPEDSGNVWCPSHKIILEDFKDSLQGSCPTACPFDSKNDVFLSQYDMAVTQLAFVGLAVTFPKELGIHFATEDDLEGFIHVWRVLGHLLGIQDHYNYCNTHLDAVRKRTLDFIDFALKPSLLHVTSDWEHMSRCLTAGISFYVIGVTFEASMAHVCSILKIPVPKFRRSFNWMQSTMNWLQSFTFKYIYRVPGVLWFFNGLLYKAIDYVKNASEETLRNWEKKEFYVFKRNEMPPSG